MKIWILIHYYRNYVLFDRDFNFHDNLCRNDFEEGRGYARATLHDFIRSLYGNTIVSMPVLQHCNVIEYIYISNGHGSFCRCSDGIQVE